MEDASSSPAAAQRAALHHELHYVLEPEWPHRAVPVSPRQLRRDQPCAAEATAAATQPASTAG